MNMYHVLEALLALYILGGIVGGIAILEHGSKNGDKVSGIDALLGFLIWPLMFGVVLGSAAHNIQADEEAEK